MSPAELLDLVEQHGAVLVLDGERLRLRAPSGFPESLRSEARAQKSALIALMQSRAGALRAELGELSARFQAAEFMYGAGRIPAQKADAARERLLFVIDRAAVVYDEIDRIAPELLDGFAFGMGEGND